jgi:hypothetical protein
VHPLFLKAAEVYGDAIRELLALGPQPPTEKIAPIVSRFRRRIEAVRKRHADAKYTPSADDPLEIILDDAEGCSSPPSQRGMNQGFLKTLYWWRFREPLWIAMQKSSAGDLRALRRARLP